VKEHRRANGNSCFGLFTTCFTAFEYRGRTDCLQPRHAFAYDEGDPSVPNQKAHRHSDNNYTLPYGVYVGRCGLKNRCRTFSLLSLVGAAGAATNVPKGPCATLLHARYHNKDNPRHADIACRIKRTNAGISTCSSSIKAHPPTKLRLPSPRGSI
jgi:hypothetical protein